MPLCTKTRTAPVYPKLTGFSEPRGHRITMMDMGPDVSDPEKRYVLTHNETESVFADPTSAHDAWMSAFQTVLAETRAA